MISKKIHKMPYMFCDLGYCDKSLHFFYKTWEIHDIQPF